MDFQEGLVEAIREGEIVKMTESQALEEDLFVLRKIFVPSKVEGPPIKKVEEKVVDFTSRYTKQGSTLEEWRKRKVDYERNDVIKDLVDNFHWNISRARRSRGLTRKQLADEMKIKEEELKIIEFGRLPSDDFVLINLIERHLGISLKKERRPEEVRLADLQRMNDEKIREAIDKARGVDRKELDITGSDIEIVED